MDPRRQKLINFVIRYHPQLPHSNSTEQIIVRKLTDVVVTARLNIPTLYSKAPLMERTLTLTGDKMLAKSDIHRQATDVWSMLVSFTSAFLVVYICLKTIMMKSKLTKIL